MRKLRHSLVILENKCRACLAWIDSRKKKRRIAMLAREIIAINKGAPINYLDIGSAGGMHPAWRQLIESGFCKAILVDMADEYARNSQAFADNATHIKTALSDHTGSAKAVACHLISSSCKNIL
jgi:hypothetical protein